MNDHQAALAVSEEARRRLEVILGELRREKFGAKSEKLRPDQYHLPLEDVEIAQGVLDAAQEKTRVVEALKGVMERGLVELVWLEQATWQALQDAMQQGPWHILHYTGHAFFDPRIGEGALAMTGKDGTAWLLSATQLGRLLADQRSLRLAVLNGGTVELIQTTEPLSADSDVPRAGGEIPRAAAATALDGLGGIGAVLRYDIA